LNSTPLPIPVALTLKKKTQCLVVEFSDGLKATLPAEYLRVHSPSAEVTGHRAGEGILVTGKESVGVDRLEPVGRYAVRIVFDDGHDSGLFSWRVLYDLSINQEQRWQRYMERLAEAGHERARVQ